MATIVPAQIAPQLRFPPLADLQLDAAEQKALTDLRMKIDAERVDALIADSFYMGVERIDNLDIAIPASVWDGLRMVAGWPRVAVDPHVEVLSVEGFRLPADTDVNPDLGKEWDANGLIAKQLMAFTDAFSMGRGYWLAGVDESGEPRITIESPLNMSVRWDSSGEAARWALQVWEVDELGNLALQVPGQTIHVTEESRGKWTVRRSKHKMQRIPVHRMANNARSDRRNGFSNITPELMTLVVGAARRMVGLEVASELYSVPRMLLLGAQESDFQDPTGAVRKAWDTYINLVNALERDDDGNLPDVKQLMTYDPSVFTKVIEMYASQAAGILAAPPQDLGLYTDGNPTSSEAWDALETRRNRRAKKAQREFTPAIVGVMQDDMRLRHGGVLPPEYERIAIDWAPIGESMTADSLTKLVAAGSIPPRSDVTMKHAGFTAVERAQLERDWVDADRQDALAKIADDVAALRGRVDQPGQRAEGTTPAQVTDGNASTGR